MNDHKLLAARWVRFEFPFSGKFPEYEGAHLGIDGLHSLNVALDIQAAIDKAREEGRQQGRREGIEEAAAWHDELAESHRVCAETTTPAYRADHRGLASDHRGQAKAIRALADRSPETSNA